MEKKPKRLSGADIEFINQLRGKEEPVYEVTDGRKHYRPRLTDTELILLDQDRKRRMGLVADILLSSPKFDKSKYQVQIVITHKKKRYTSKFSSK